MSHSQWLGYWFVLGVLAAPMTSLYAGENSTVTDTEVVSQALEQQRDRIMWQPGVVGTGLSLCDGEPCIKILVVRCSPELQRALEQILANQRFIIEESGPIRAQPEKK
jgi:hypothetical protein